MRTLCFFWVAGLLATLLCSDLCAQDTYVNRFKQIASITLAQVGDTLSEPVRDPRKAVSRWFEYDPAIISGEKPNFNILPLFMSSPERGIGFGLKLARQAVLEKKDILSAQAIHTLKNKGSISIKYEFAPGWRDKWPSEISVTYETFEKYYYGIGQSAKVQDESLYQPEYLDINLPFLYAITSKLNLGLFVDFENWKLIRIDTKGALSQDAAHLVGVNAARLFTTGILMRWDSRDSKTDPSCGQFVEGVYEYSKRYLGSEADFTRTTLDLRHFYPIFGDDHHVLAARAFADYKTGDVPFYKLPELGGIFFNRGLFEGRYRDNLALCANLEYRIKIYHRLHWAFL